MEYLRKKIASLKMLIRRELFRDHALLEAKRWVKDDGDRRLRLDYPLDEDGLVFDLGGYRGDYAESIVRKFGCRVFVFEPVLSFYETCVSRFSGDSRVQCFNFGLSSRNQSLEISLASDGSSFFRGAGRKEVATLKSVRDFFEKNSIDQVDLIKINIEGGEYDVLPELIASGLIRRVRYLLIQFHSFVPNADVARRRIQEDLAKTHVQMWNYDYVWECWSLSENGAWNGE